MYHNAYYTLQFQVQKAQVNEIAKPTIVDYYVCCTITATMNFK